MSTLTAMLKWAMRIVAVGGVLLAMAVGTAAWMHRTQGRMLLVYTPKVCSCIAISPRYVNAWGWLRCDCEPDWRGRYGIVSKPQDNSETKNLFDSDTRIADYVKEWNGFGLMQGDPAIRSYSAVLCPTWALITVLLLPMGLWAGIGWRQRRRVKAGHCAHCGYDLRATPEKCPECGTAVKNKC